MKQFKEAFLCYEKSLAILPSDHNVKFNVAICHKLSGDKGTALTLLKELASNGSTDHSVYAQIGYLEKDLTHWQESYEAFDKASKLNK